MIALALILTFAVLIGALALVLTYIDAPAVATGEEDS